MSRLSPGVVRVLVVDDHAVVRAGLETVLSAAPGIELVAAVGAPADALAAAANQAPDVALLDISLPGQTGVDLLPALQDCAPGMRVIALSVHDEREYAIAMARAGAHGYLRKDCDPLELVAAIRRVAAGGTAFSERATELIVSEHVQTGAGTRQAGDALLTPRQREVLIAVAQGHSNREIATRLGIGVRTVETHRRAIQQRLGISGVAGLTRYAIQRGYVALD